MAKRQSTRDYIKDTLTERILNGFYPPGERLVELHIAEELGTSQGPVREALRDLAALGLVESESYRGTRVRQFTEQEIEESYQVRSVLEQLAAELAAPHLRNNTAALEQEVAAFMQAAKNRDVKLYSLHDMDFHRLIVNASANQLLANMWNSVVLESKFRFTLIHRIGEDELENLAAAHVPILDALREGDGTKAGELARKLICTFHSRKPGLQVKRSPNDT
ncbi:MAG: GntR family transcriptional regulator [Candidatus Obscuribacterales bacterium]|nr:GntR family transcriptional regulator [Candidatus Obscuribacterales bacterium]